MNTFIGAFLTVKSACEAIILTAKKVIDTIDALVQAIENFLTKTVATTVNAIYSAVVLLGKALASIFDWGLAQTKICTSMYRCSYLLEELLNPNSMFTRTLVKYTSYDPSHQQGLANTIATYNQFKRDVCNFGFTFDIGVESTKKWLEEKQAWCLEQIAVITRNRRRIRKKIQSYFNFVMDLRNFAIT